VEFPEPLWEVEVHPHDFHGALDLQMRRHGEPAHRLHRALKSQGGLTDRKTISDWRRGIKTPQTPASLKVVDLIEARYRLPSRYLRSRLSQPRATAGLAPSGVEPSEARRLAWHLPDDFRQRPPRERAEILAWVRTNVLSGGTAYSQYHSQVSKHRFSLRFDDEVLPQRQGRDRKGCLQLVAPPELQREMTALVRFKSSTLTEIGFQRSGVWGEETAAQRGEHLSLLFGALAASATGEVRGLGVRLEHLSFAHLVFPAVWDWYVQWRERRRGFFTGWEGEMLLLAAALTREKTGWLRQSPGLVDRLVPIDGLVSFADIEAAKTDWDGACDRMKEHALQRAKEIARVARIHRDPFEPLLPVLEAASPVGEYRKITDEILKRMPDARRYPRAAAEAVRSLLMIRLGLHLGLRQKNLRQMLLCPRDGVPRAERELERMKCGELRWSERDEGWEVFIPCAAFKNAGSAYFSKRPFRLVLPDLGDLYTWLDAYVRTHRPVLLAGACDPGTVFVKTRKRNSTVAAYNQNTFYEAWRLIIQRYGIYNPYTGRGAIPGLLPHGPHSVRDVLATHVLKTTGSYEQASYAIQDTPATVQAHYGRFLPQDKAALAATILNKVWA
jgi:integrase